MIDLIETVWIVSIVGIVALGGNIAWNEWKWRREQKRLMRRDRDKRR